MQTPNSEPLVVSMETVTTVDSRPGTVASKGPVKTPDVEDLQSSRISSKGSVRNHPADYIHPVSGTSLFQRQPLQFGGRSDGNRGLTQIKIKSVLN